MRSFASKEVTFTLHQKRSVLYMKHVVEGLLKYSFQLIVSVDLPFTRRFYHAGPIQAVTTVMDGHQQSRKLMLINTPHDQISS